MSFLTSLIESPWAITEGYRPVIATILTRLVKGERLSAEGLGLVRQERRDWDARHASSAAAARTSDLFQRVHGADARNGDIAAIGIHGVITQRGGVDADTSEPLASAGRIARAVQAASDDDTIGAIVLDVDSPGGSVYGVTELANAIHAARQVKPVTAVANSLAASAAYWAASQASELYAAPGAEVGSIGVFMIHYDVSQALRQAGIAPTVIASNPRKVETLPYGELAPDAKAHLQGGVDEYYADFIKAVARGRNTTQKAVREEMGQGRVFGTDRAKAANMIDGVATLDQVMGKVATRLQGRGGSRAIASTAARQSQLRREYIQREIEILLLENGGST